MPGQVPLARLYAFEAAGRHGSLRAAADELCRTPSAVSHAITKLERELGSALLERDGRSVRLTADGQTLMRHLRLAFDEIRCGVETVSTRGPQLLRLHSAPSFAAQWLVPRLAGFLASCPGVEVRLAANTDYVRFAAGEFDADIVYGMPDQPGLTLVPLGDETVTPLCAPGLAGAIGSAADLLGQVLIESDNKRVRWSDWLAANGLVAPAPRGPRFDRSFLAIAAAADGLGVALESTRLAEREMASGRLVAPLAGRARDVRYAAHTLAYPAASSKGRALGAFAAWLRASLESPA